MHGDVKTGRKLRLSLVGAAAVLAALLSPVLGVTAAQAAPLTFKGVPEQAWSGNPDCPAKSICTWNEANFNPGGGGLSGNFPTGSNHSKWENFNVFVNNNGTANFQPNSLVDNSGSAIYLYDKSDNEWSCVSGSIEATSLLSNRFGYFFITFNESLCSTGPPTPLP